MANQFVSGFFLIAVFAAVTLAQSAVEQSIKNARDQFSDVKNRSVEMERVKRQAAKRTASDNSTIRFPEIKEDFEQIQKINSDVFEIAAVKTPVNYGAVLRFVSEINKRAVRLKSNLFGSEPQLKKESKNKQLNNSLEAEDIKILFRALDKSIDAFTHSSIFQNINVVNSTDSLAAQNDLESVIKISSSIKEKVKKTTKFNSR